jgi:hypothetical protein
MRLIEHLDELGYDEVWIGEHHSFARELIADPMIFIAAAAARTKRIKLGTGVTSLPYHHPFLVADRMLQLDHMTEGRAMLGVGPGVLASDAYMMGIDPLTQRPRMNEALDAIMQLFRTREPLNIQSDWFTMRDARLQMANYTFPYTLVMSLSFILLAYTSSVFPLFSKIFGKGGDSIRYACEKSFKYLFTLMLPICVGTTLLADRIIYTIYGPNFGGAIPVLQVLIWLLLFMVITNIGFPLLTATHRERLNMYIMAITAVLNIALNILLIPSYGAVGSSVASLLTLGVMNAALTLYAIRDDLSGANVLGSTIKVIGASVVMAVFIILVPMNNLLLYVDAGGIVYFAALLLIGGISEDDVDIAGKIIFGNKAGSSAILSMVKRLVARH